MVMWLGLPFFYMKIYLAGPKFYAGATNQSTFIPLISSKQNHHYSGENPSTFIVEKDGIPISALSKMLFYSVKF